MGTCCTSSSCGSLRSINSLRCQQGPFGWITCRRSTRITYWSQTKIRCPIKANHIVFNIRSCGRPSTLPGQSCWTDRSGYSLYTGGACCSCGACEPLNSLGTCCSCGTSGTGSTCNTPGSCSALKASCSLRCQQGPFGWITCRRGTRITYWSKTKIRSTIVANRIVFCIRTCSRPSTFPSQSCWTDRSSCTSGAGCTIRTSHPSHTLQALGSCCSCGSSCASGTLQALRTNGSCRARGTSRTSHITRDCGKLYLLCSGIVVGG